MLPQLKKYICRTTLLFYLLFVTGIAIAQNNEDDQTTDSVQELIVSPSAQEKTEAETKEEHKKYFSDLSSYQAADSVQLRQLPDSLVKEMQGKDDFWYANAIFEKEKVKKKADNSYVPLGQRTWFKTLLWLIIIGGFAGFIMWYLASSNIGLFRKKQKTIPDNEGDEIIAEDIFAINYQKEIDKASQQGNYRFAIRLMFLRLLKDLSEKNIIQYKQDRTNFDYLLQLHPTRYYNDFFRITRNYEYSWYGLFDITEEAYSLIKIDFDNFSNRL